MKAKQILIELLEAIASDDPEGIENTAALLVQLLDADELETLGLGAVACAALVVVKED